MPVDLEGLNIIDSLLDAAIELCLMPDTWTPRELALLNKLHHATLRLHQLWMSEDAPSGQFIHDVQPVLSILRGYLELIEMSISADKQEIFAPYATKLNYYASLIIKKIDIFRYRQE